MRPLLAMRLGVGVFLLLGATALFLAATDTPEGDGPAGETALLAEPSAAIPRRDPSTGDSLWSIVVTRNLFTPARRPPDRRAAQDSETVIDVARPPLRLEGLVEGVVPIALVSGMPGSDGSTALRVGDTLGALTVRAIRGGVVHITGLDTVWALRLQEPWQ